MASGKTAVFTRPSPHAFSLNSACWFHPFLWRSASYTKQDPHSLSFVQLQNSPLKSDLPDCIMDPDCGQCGQVWWLPEIPIMNFFFNHGKKTHTMTFIFLKFLKSTVQYCYNAAPCFKQSSRGISSFRTETLLTLNSNSSSPLDSGSWHPISTSSQIWGLQVPHVSGVMECLSFYCRLS